jgi:hypothetical protein
LAGRRVVGFYTDRRTKKVRPVTAPTGRRFRVRKLETRNVKGKPITRSEHAWKMDERRKAKNVTEDVEKWAERPNRLDMLGVDTPSPDTTGGRKKLIRRWEIHVDNWRESRDEIVREEAKTDFRVNVVAGDLSVRFKQVPTPEERAFLKQKGFEWKPVKKAWEKQYSGLFGKDFLAKHEKAVDEGRQLIGTLRGRGLFYYAVPSKGKGVVAFEIWE